MQQKDNSHDSFNDRQLYDYLQLDDDDDGEHWQ